MTRQALHHKVLWSRSKYGWYKCGSDLNWWELKYRHRSILNSKGSWTSELGILVRMNKYCLWWLWVKSSPWAPLPEHIRISQVTVGVGDALENGYSFAEDFVLEIQSVYFPWCRLGRNRPSTDCWVLVIDHRIARRLIQIVVTHSHREYPYKPMSSGKDHAKMAIPMVRWYLQTTLGAHRRTQPAVKVGSNSIPIVYILWQTVVDSNSYSKFIDSTVNSRSILHSGLP